MTAGPHGTTSSDFGLLELDREECLSLLASVPVGRLVYTSRAMPAVVPLCFVLRQGSVYLRTTEAAGLRVTRDGVVVAFEADAFDADHRTGWSVVVLGRAVIETDPFVLTELGELPLVPWASGDRQQVLRIPVDLITGRRVGTGPAPHANREQLVASPLHQPITPEEP